MIREDLHKLQVVFAQFLLLRRDVNGRSEARRVLEILPTTVTNAPDCALVVVAGLPTLHAGI